MTETLNIPQSVELYMLSGCIVLEVNCISVKLLWKKKIIRNSIQACGFVNYSLKLKFNFLNYYKSIWCVYIYISAGGKLS